MKAAHRTRSKKNAFAQIARQSPHAIALWIFIALLFIGGGGSRDDIPSLLWLRPLAALLAGYALWGLRRETLVQSRFLVGFLAACVVLVAIHLVPLPPAIWSALPGRALVLEVDRVAGIADPWRPISLVPHATWNALFSLLVPAAVLLLAIRASEQERVVALWVLILGGVATCMMGALQIANPNSTSLYFYRISNFGQSVGLFANRNHQGVFLALLMPMISAMVALRMPRWGGWALLASGLLLAALILVTGSRAGLVIGAMGMAAALWFYSQSLYSSTGRRISRNQVRLLYLGAFATLVLLTLVFLLLSRAEAVRRLVESFSGGGDIRTTAWRSTWQLGWRYFPTGSGIGSFVDVYKVDEPLASLDFSYFNHAHNEPLEIFLTAGAPGILLLVIGVAAWSIAVRRLLLLKKRGPRMILGQLGAVLTALLAVASIVDYPLRTPVLMGMYVLACVWLCDALKPSTPLSAKIASRE